MIGSGRLQLSRDGSQVRVHLPAGETGAGAGGEFSLEARRVFKIFLDYEENKLRLVLREDGGEHLQMKDYESGQIK